MYKVRVILDTPEDVIRTFLVDENIDLENLHNQITKAFGFEGQELASFYRTDDEWNQGEEIPLFHMAETGNTISMQNCILKEILPIVNSKLIYVYDFLNMWTFYVDLVEVLNEKRTDLPQLILSVGNLPNEAPKKEFIAEIFEDDLENQDELDDDFDPFDEFDFNDY